jgi:hypothetical protein
MFMIHSHEDGLNIIQSLKKQFNREIELLCLNSSFLDISQLLIKAQELAKISPQVVLKESEFHELENPYYEISVFCHDKDLNSYIALVESYGLTIDLVHEYE